MVSSIRYDTSAKTLNQIANGKQDQKTNALWQTDANMFRSSPVKHTPAVYKSDYQNPLAAQLFTSSEDDCQTSDNYVLEEDGGDPLTCGDSDFEPAEHAARTVIAQPRQHNNFFDLEVGHTSQFNQGRGDMYNDLDQKLQSEHEAALQLEDNAAIILHQRSSKKHSENNKISSHPSKNQNTTKQVPAKQGSSLSNKQKPQQESVQAQSSEDEEDLKSDMQQSSRQQSSNVRRFARNTGTYQASFSKQNDFQKQDRYKNDSSYSSEENDTLMNQDFRGKYFIDARDIEMQQIQNSSVFETDFYSNAAKVKMQQNWAEETFKNTGVGFSPAPVVQTFNQEKGTALSSFGWNGVEKKPVATFETAQQMRENKEKSPSQEQVYEYGAMMYPQKQISEAVWAEQNKNMVKPTGTKERKKKKKDNEAHFLLTGQFAQYMDQRSFFKNSDDGKQKVNAPDRNNREALIEWFDSLSLQDRINSCTSTYPIMVSSILDAQQKQIRIDGVLCLFTLKKDKNVDQDAKDGTSRRRYVQEMEQNIFERVPSQDDRYRSHTIYCGAQTSVRAFLTKIIKLVRITTNKQPNDTLTVYPELVRDTLEFFSLLENITDGKAFAQPVSYVSKNGGKPQIQSPKWIDASKSNFMGVWIVAMIEESLWAHFNYSRQVNIQSSVRKQELHQLFELRSDNLNDQEQLAQRWVELGEEGQHKILQQLSQTAREEPPSKFNQIYDEQERKQNFQHSQYNEDIFSICQYGRHGIFNFTEVSREDYYMKHYEQQSGNMNNYHLYQCADKFLMQCQHDSDLKEIIDSVQYIGSLSLIKFLSEFPLTEINQRNYVRKHYLCQQLHLLIQANLRQSIQDQLIHETVNSDNDKNMSLDLDQKKSKKKQFENRRKKNNQKQQQTYQKKELVSKSPQREPVVVQPAPQPKKQQQPQKLDDKRLASTTTSDDQHVEKKGKKVKDKKNQSKSQEAIAAAKQLLVDLVDSVIDLITQRELKAAESSEEQQEPEPAAISKVVAKPENVPSKPRRKNKKPKKQDAEELVNNFMRKLNGGDDDDSKNKNTKKQPVTQQKQQQHQKQQQKAVTIQTPKQEPKKIEKSVEKAKPKKASPVKEVIKPELKETQTSIIFEVEQSEVKTQIPYIEQTEDVISMQPQKEEPVPVREKISLTDHFSTTLRDFQIDETAQMNFTQEWPSQSPNMMSTTSVSFTPTIPALQVSPPGDKKEIIDYQGSPPIMHSKFQNPMPIQPIPFYNQPQPQQYVFEKPQYPFRQPEYQKVVKNKPVPFRQPQYYATQMVNHSPTSSDYQYDSYTKNKSGAIEPPFYQPFGPIGSPHPLDLTSSSSSASNPKDAQIRLDAPSFQPIQKSHSEDFRAWNYQQPQYQPIKQQFSDQIQVPTQQHPLYLQIEDHFYRSFDKDIEKQTIKIQTFIEKFQEERCYVIERLQQMANVAFPGRTPTIKVFGSLMTGLALESSDMDIAVTGLRIDDREDMIDDLNALGDQVQKWSLIKDYKSIETASIPVIKAHLRLQDVAKEMGKTFNHSDPDVELPIDITFDDSPEPAPVQPTQLPIYIQEPYIQQPPLIQKPTDPMTQLQNLISGEFGINIQDSLIGFGMEFGGPPPPKTHLGLASCALLKDYVRTYPHLKEVVILLKRFLTVNNLNQSYLGKIFSNFVGGISSYSAVLLVVAYMNYFELQQSARLTPSRLLMGFLDFYSNCFDPRQFGVNTSNGKSFYPLPQMNQQMFVIVDPVNPTNNTARNSFRTPDVLAHFRAAFYSLKSQITKQYQKQLADPDWGDSFSLAGQPAKFEKPAEQRTQKHGKNGKTLVDPVKAAMEQQVPTFNGATVAFDSVNFVEHFLSNDILRQGADTQAMVVEALSGFGVAF